MRPTPVLFSLSLLTVLCTTVRAQVFVSGATQAILVQGPQAAASPGQLSADAIALESVEIGPPVKGAPFSAEAMTEIIQPLVDGNRIVRRTRGSLHRDSRGRTRREVNLEGIAGLMLAGAPLHMITINDPESGMTYVVDANQRLFVMQNAPDRARIPTDTSPGSPRGRGPSQVQQTATGERTEALGTREIEGLVCEGTRTIVTIPAGAIGNERAIESVSERWFSRALRIVVLSRSSDPRFGETTYRLMKVTRAEPPPALFERPAP